ncbi:MAG: RelA/SpoT domain-containing protein [Archangium sp.]
MKTKVLVAGTKFVERLDTRREQLVTACNELRSFLERVLLSRASEIHAISARPKDTASLREKILRKKYTEPARQVTDLLGGRVIVLFSDHVDPIAQVIREHLEIDDRRSIDKRSALGGAEFGYRSVHLVGRVSESWRRQCAILKPFKFEIQVRSLLEHAWSEIEHEVIYKSGSDPQERKREFASLAGMLELVDRKFCEARAAEARDVDTFRSEFELGKHIGENLDGIKMLAILGSKTQGPLLPRRFTQMALRLLEASKITTTTALELELEQKWFKKAVQSFCTRQNPVIAPRDVPQLTAIALIAKQHAPKTLAFALPDIAV